MNRESSILLIKVHRESGGLYNLKSCIDFEYIKGFLDKNNIYVGIHEDQLIPTLVEIVDDIIFQGYKNILFYIDHCNFKLSNKIISGIREEEKNVDIFAFGELEQNSMNELVENGLSLWISENIEETLLNILRKKTSNKEEKPFEQLEILDSWNSMEKIMNKIDAYEKTIAVKASVNKKTPGKNEIIEHSVKYWNDLIALVEKSNVLLNVYNICDLTDIKMEELLNKMTPIAEKTQLTIHYHQLSKHLIPKILNFNHITLVIDAQGLNKSNNERDYFFNFLNLFCIEKLTIDFHITEKLIPQVKDFMNDLKQIMQLQMLQIQFNCENHVREKILGVFPELYKRELNPFINGFIVSNTGLYPEAITGFGTKHAYIKQLNDSFDDAFKELMNVNNACIQQTGEILDQSKIHNPSSSSFTNYHTMVNNENIFINNHKNLEISFTSLKDTILDNTKDINFTELSDHLDFDIFVEAVERFQEKGIILSSNLIRSYLINSCMWSGGQACQVLNLPRIYIDRSGSVSPCKGCEHAIGNLTDGKSKLLKSVNLHVNKERVQRDCSTCIVRNSCSKCTYLPHFIEVDKYCEVRRKYIVLEEFIFSNQVMFYLKSYSKLFRDIKLEDIILPNSCFSTMYQGEKHSEPVPFYRSFCLINYKEDYMVFDTLNQSIVKVNKAMAYILEGIIKHASKLQIIDSLTEKFNLNKEKAIEFLENCENKFSENNWKYYIT